MSDCTNPTEISGVESVWPIVHRKFRTCVEFDRLTDQLERSLGKFDLAAPPLNSTLEETALMIFLIVDHGKALSLTGDPGKAKQYLIGNPLTADQMTRHQLGAALYAPVRVLVYESAGGECIVEYDKPSSVFGNFNDPHLRDISVALDNQLSVMLQSAVLLAGA